MGIHRWPPLSGSAVHVTDAQAYLWEAAYQATSKNLIMLSQAGQRCYTPAFAGDTAIDILHQLGPMITRESSAEAAATLVRFDEV